MNVNTRLPSGGDKKYYAKAKKVLKPLISIVPIFYKMEKWLSEKTLS